jgi:membrane-bound lytic murein transglycosylase D
MISWAPKAEQLAKPAKVSPATNGVAVANAPVEPDNSIEVEPQGEASKELEQMAQAQQMVLQDKDWRLPDENDYSPIEGMEQPVRTQAMREDCLLLELGTQWLRVMGARPGGLPLSTARGKRARGFDIPVVVNDQVQKLINFLQCNATKPIFSRWLGRTTRYNPIMKSILRKYGVPEDMVAVALIESGLSYSALSRAMASGPWQFIKGTGSAYGLKSDFWIDERRDIVKATDAAARHLRDLYNHFNDWYLAWAAYNAGAAVVDRAIERLGTTDFWEIASSRYLRNETKQYVPKILAAALIEKNPEQYGFTEITYLPPLEWDEVEIKGMADLRAAAQAVGVAPELIQELNPELRYWCSPPYLQTYRLRIPKGSTGRFHANYHPAVRNTQVSFSQHRLRQGETLGHVAMAYHTSVEALMAANHISNPRKISTGKILLVPVQPCGNPAAKPPSAPAPAGKAPEKNQAEDSYTIRSGDTLSEIALKHHISIETLTRINKFESDAILMPGTVIKVKDTKK